MSFLSEFQHVTKIYPGTLSPVLDDISFSVSYRDSIAILGPSGSGKTTLLNILGTLDRPTSGQLIMEGEQTANLDKNKLAELRNQRIGFVFQLHYLLPQLNLIENVLLPLLPEKDNIRKSAARDRAFHLLEKVGLKSLVHQQPASLSVGECQRAAVVRALINQPIL
ncbi:MAG: ATP-binding cassette domain-containing protein, partial [Bacteroidota bacterium]